MQLVIDIPEEMYQTIKETNVVISGRRSGRRFDYVLFDAVSTGAPLPKGHGRLIDLNDLYDFDRRKVEYAPTIIEADKEVEDAGGKM